jgi:hypothetical protein
VLCVGCRGTGCGPESTSRPIGVLRGVCVVKSKAITILFGALIASSFSSPTQFGPGRADAADAALPAVPQANGVPEFVPVVNFSQFVLAMETFAAENPNSARVAAEELSAKFAQNSQPQNIELHAAAAPVIVTRPVVIASVSVSGETARNFPAVPDPAGRPQIALADPIKTATEIPSRPVTSSKTKKDKKDASATSRQRIEKKFEPAMGLGMVIESAEDAPPISSLQQKKRKVTAASRNAD